MVNYTEGVLVQLVQLTEVEIINQSVNMFALLRTKEILAILDGDVDLGTLKINGSDTSIKISMPYLSGSALCDISRKFGLPVTYSWSGAQSRWTYLDNLIEHCIKNGQASNLLTFLFSKGQFVDKLRGNSPDVIEYAHAQIVSAVIGQINGALYFGGNELVRCGNAFTIRKIGTTVTVDAPAVKKIDRPYILDVSERAFKDIAEENYDSAITKSRTLLEEVFIYAIEKKGEHPSEAGEIGKLYAQVKTLYSMHQSKDADKRINGLLSGLEKIVTAITEMRNRGSDSHGVGSKRLVVADHHARLFVNSATTMADFILSVCEKQTNNGF